MAQAAKTAPEFDYMAYMVLKNGLYTEVERIGKTRKMLAPEWKPAPGSNKAMLLALEVYRDKRAAPPTISPNWKLCRPGMPSRNNSRE